MPIPLPKLDNRNYDDLVREMRAMIPLTAPGWTNHNISDPGITLIELLAWVTESSLYRVNRIPPATIANFISLLLGESSVQSDEFKEAMSGVTTTDIEREARRVSTEIEQVFVRYAERENRVSVMIVVRTGTNQATDIIIAARKWLRELYLSGPEILVESLDTAKQRALRFFNESHRAITLADFERESMLASPLVGRVAVTAIPELGTISVTIVPAVGHEPDASLLATVKQRLQERKLVGTRVVVRPPVYTDINLGISLVMKPNTVVEDIITTATETVNSFFDPLSGGSDATGWPFDRPLSVYELYNIIESIAGVDHVDGIEINGVAEARETPIHDLPNLVNLEINAVI